jgi:putative component of toxin-antitoxin plasmid stabilization module
MLEYEDEDGDSPFSDWFDALHATAAARVTMALVRLEQGIFGDSKKAPMSYRFGHLG